MLRNIMNGLSVIIPIFNTEKYLPRCLDSVLFAKHPIEVILIDDGSTDDSGKICDRYAKANKRFSVIHQTNQGLVETRKIGIEKVKTEFFTFLDSDDYWDTEEYDGLLDEIEGAKGFETDIICTGMTEEYLEKKTEKVNRFCDGVYCSEELIEMRKSMLSNGAFFNFGVLPNAVCKIYRTSFVRNNHITISSNVTAGEDADMTYQLLLKAKTVTIINRTPYHYCRRNTSMMWQAKAKEEIMALENDLKNAFSGEGSIREILLSQLKDYIDFVWLLCRPQEVLQNCPFFEDKSRRFALYGAGGVGQAVKCGMSNNFSLWVDENYLIYNEEGVKPIEALVDECDSYDKIFIAISSRKTCEDIKKSLMKLGITKPIYYYRCEDSEFE